METNIIFLLTIILIVAIIYVTKWLYHLLWLDWDSNGIPIQGYFWIWLHKYRLAEHLVVNLRESSTRPPFVALRMIFGGPFVYVPLRAETTKRMLMFQTKELCKTPGNDLTRKRQPRLMELSFGNLNGDAWHKRHKILRRSFENLGHLVPLFADSVSQLFNVWNRGLFNDADPPSSSGVGSATSNRQVQIDIKPWMSCFALDILTQVLMGIELHAMPTNCTNDGRPMFSETGMSQNFQKALKSLYILMNAMGDVVNKMTPDFIPLPQDQQIHDALDQFNTLTSTIIEQKRTQLMKKDPETYDMLDNLVIELDRPQEQNTNLNSKTTTTDDIAMRQIQHDLFFFMLAGHETTASSLCWIIFELARHPHVQDALRTQIRLKKSDTNSWSKQDLSADNLPLLHAIIHATLAVHPPAGFGGMRKVVAEKGGCWDDIHLPKGTLIWVSPRLMHELRPESGTFSPDKFLSSDGKFVSPPTDGTYMPFGMGMRTCISKNLAELEMAILISMLVSEYEILPSVSLSETSIATIPHIMLNSPRRVPVLLRRLHTSCTM